MKILKWISLQTYGEIIIESGRFIMTIDPDHMSCYFNRDNFCHATRLGAEGGFSQSKIGIFLVDNRA